MDESSELVVTVPSIRVDFSPIEGSVERNALQEAELKGIIDNAQRLLRKARSEATWTAYQSDWRQFEAYCKTYKLPALPTTTNTLISFLSKQAADGLAPSTIKRRLISIRVVHKGSGYPPPDDAHPRQAYGGQFFHGPLVIRAPILASRIELHIAHSD